MPLVFGHDQVVADWAAERVGAAFHPPYVAWGVTDATGMLTGALVFNEFYRGGNISLSLAGQGAMRREVLRAAAIYVFRQLGCTRVTARTRRSNLAMRRILGRSWKFECTQPRWFGPERADDALVFVMFPEMAERWIARRKVTNGLDTIAA